MEREERVRRDSCESKQMGADGNGLFKRAKDNKRKMQTQTVWSNADIDTKEMFLSFLSKYVGDSF